ncbi:TPA: hypothetical protein DCP42_03610, partial [Patescibacteria group bacterium]|nr:hypothetical protein [Patescibacteria group bacterium]
QQIQASKEEAAMIVESEQTRYSTQKRGIAVKLGGAIIDGYESILDKVKKGIPSIKSITSYNIVKETQKVTKKTSKKKKKNKKH